MEYSLLKAGLFQTLALGLGFVSRSLTSSRGGVRLRAEKVSGGRDNTSSSMKLASRFRFPHVFLPSQRSGSELGSLLSYLERSISLSPSQSLRDFFMFCPSLRTEDEKMKLVTPSPSIKKRLLFPELFLLYCQSPIAPNIRMVQKTERRGSV